MELLDEEWFENGIDNSKLFFLIFRNIYLNSLIFKHSRLYNQYSKPISFKSIREYDNFQFKDYIKDLDYNFPKIVKLSNSLEILRLGDTFWNHINQNLILSIPKRFIPNSVTKLYFSNSFNKMVSLNADHLIPNSVTKLDIGNGFDRVIKKEDAPKSVKSIKFGKCFNKTFNFIDCLELKKIKFDKLSFFNQDIPIDHLPNGLELIIFGELFNREILTNSLPISLTRLDFTNSAFNKPITAFRNLINLIELSFGNHFQCKIEPGDLPLDGKLEILRFGSVGYTKKFKLGTLPQSLTTLDVKCYKQHFDTVGVLPSNLKTLEIGFPFTNYTKPFKVGVFPQSITRLFFGYDTNFNFPFQEGILPSSLKEFSFCFYEFPIKKGILPDSIELLSLPTQDGFNRLPPVDAFPKNLKHLCINTELKYSIYQGQLPMGLERIQIKHDVIIEPNSLPSTVYTLAFVGPTFNKINIISETLKSIYVYCDTFNHIFEPFSLPKNLENLSIASSIYNQPFEKDSLPDSLLNLALPSHYNHPIITNYKKLNISIGNKFFKQNFYGLHVIKGFDLPDYENIDSLFLE